MKLRCVSIAAMLVAAWSVVIAQEADEQTLGTKAPSVGEQPEIAEPAEAYKNRRQPVREPLEHEARVTAALDWLVDHQASDGSWSTWKFLEHSTRKDAAKTYNLEFHKPGDENGDLGWTKADAPIVGLTGLCLMAFTAAGYDHKTGAYAVPVRRALDYLLEQQLPEGGFVKPQGDRFTYEQATVTIAIADIYGLTGDVALKRPLEMACACIMAAQNPGLGWRYESQAGINDTHCTGYMMLALHRAKQAGLKLHTKHADEGVLKWFDLVCVEVDGLWKTGYDSPGSNNSRLRNAQEFPHNESLDSLHGAVRLWLGKTVKKDKMLPDLRRRLRDTSESPRWAQQRVDLQFWFWASLFSKGLGDEDWLWREPMDEVLVAHQRGFCDQDAGTTPETLDEYGSWDAVTCWSPCGGRPYTTAMGAILLCMDLQ